MGAAFTPAPKILPPAAAGQPASRIMRQNAPRARPGGETV
jgi:hypothetical protein